MGTLLVAFATSVQRLNIGISAGAASTTCSNVNLLLNFSEQKYYEKDIIIIITKSGRLID